MMIRLILAIAFLVLLFWLYKKWQRLPLKKRKDVGIKGILITAGILTVLAVLTGRMHWLGAVFAGLLALGRFGLVAAMRALPFLRMVRSTPFINNPRFKTPFLDVRIDLASVQVTGTIIDGPHSGKPISELDEKALDELEKYYEAHNKASFYLIRVIRQKQAQNSHQQQSRDFSSTDNPSLDEAFQVLGLSTEANKKDVVKAHRSLMQKLHPDRGGNDYLASRVNLAKDILLKHFDENDRK